MKTLLLIALLLASSSAALLEGIWNPTEADVTIAQDKSSFKFDTKIWHYRTRGTLIAEGMALQLEPAEKLKDNIGFLKSITSQMTEIGSNNVFTGIDFRLIEDCNFIFKSKFLGAEYYFFVQGAEQYNQNRYKVTVSYRAFSGVFGGINVRDLVNGLKTDCIKRNAVVEKSKQGYWDSSKTFFNSKAKFDADVKKINGDLMNTLLKSEEALQDALANYEKVKTKAHDIAAKNKAEATAKFDLVKAAYDSAKNHLVAVVPSVKDAVEKSHLAGKVEEWGKGVEELVCKGCGFNN